MGTSFENYLNEAKLYNQTIFIDDTIFTAILTRSGQIPYEFMRSIEKGILNGLASAYSVPYCLNSLDIERKDLTSIYLTRVQNLTYLPFTIDETEIASKYIDYITTNENTLNNSQNNMNISIQIATASTYAEKEKKALFYVTFDSNRKEIIDNFLNEIRREKSIKTVDVSNVQA